MSDEDKTPTDPAPGPQPTIEDVLNVLGDIGGAIRQLQQTVGTLCDGQLEISGKIDQAIGPLRQDIRVLVERVSKLEAVEHPGANGAAE